MTLADAGNPSVKLLGISIFVRNAKVAHPCGSVQVVHVERTMVKKHGTVEFVVLDLGQEPVCCCILV